MRENGQSDLYGSDLTLSMKVSITVGKESKYRFINLALYLFACIMVYLPYQTFTPINSVVVKLYNSNKLLIAMNTLIFQISSPIFNFLVNGILDKKEFRFGCVIGAILTISGIWMRTLIGTSLWITLLGSFVCSIGCLFFMNSPSKLAINWFVPPAYSLIVTLGVLLIMFSKALSLSFPSILVDSNSNRGQILKLLLVEAIMISIPMLLIILLLKDRPKSPPSYAAQREISPNYLKDLQNLFKDRNYLLLFISYALAGGTLATFTSIIEFAILPFRYQHPIRLASLLMMVVSIFGAISSFTMTYIVKKTRSFKILLLVCYFGTAIQFILFPFSLHTFSVTALIANACAFMALMVPITPISIEFASQITFPIGQASYTGFLIAGGQTLSFLMGSIIISYLDGVTVFRIYLVYIIMGLLMAIGGVLIFFIKEDLKRTDYENERNMEDRASLEKLI